MKRLMISSILIVLVLIFAGGCRAESELIKDYIAFGGDHMVVKWFDRIERTYKPDGSLHGGDDEEFERTYYPYLNNTFTLRTLRKWGAGYRINVFQYTFSDNVVYLSKVRYYDKKRRKQAILRRTSEFSFYAYFKANEDKWRSTYKKNGTWTDFTVMSKKASLKVNDVNYVNLLHVRTYRVYANRATFEGHNYYAKGMGIIHKKVTFTYPDEAKRIIVWNLNKFRKHDPVKLKRIEEE